MLTRQGAAPGSAWYSLVQRATSRHGTEQAALERRRPLVSAEVIRSGPGLSIRGGAEGIKPCCTKRRCAVYQQYLHIAIPSLRCNFDSPWTSLLVSLEESSVMPLYHALRNGAQFQWNAVLEKQRKETCTTWGNGGNETSWERRWKRTAGQRGAKIE